MDAPADAPVMRGVDVEDEGNEEPADELCASEGKSMPRSEFLERAFPLR